jgi:2-methylcitrate dehydratase PrpD
LNGENQNGATILGTGQKTTIAGAAFANAALFHARTQEDSLGAAHFGTILVPLLTGMIEARGYELNGLIPALVAGYEVGGRLELAFAKYTTPVGLRASSVYGPSAAAAAAAKLMGLSGERISAAISLASSFSGGLLQCWNEGSDEWRYQVGQAAQTGIMAAELSRNGSTAASEIVEGRSGIAAAFARTDCDAEALCADLGSAWSISRVTFKPYPVCVFNQTPVIASLTLREQIGTAGIKAVRLRLNPYVIGYAGMDARGPFSSFAGMLMSTPACVSIALLYGEPDMQRLTDFNDGGVEKMIPKISLIADESVSIWSATMEVDVEDGRTLKTVKQMGPSDFSYDRAKVSRTLRRVGEKHAVSKATFDRLDTFVENLPNGDVRDLLAIFGTVMPMTNDSAYAQTRSAST